MHYAITPTGSLVFTLSRDEQQHWLEERDTNGYVDILDIFADSDIPGNSDLAILQPEDIGALTSSPIFGSDITYDDDGAVVAAGNVWWYPNYAVDDPGDRLLDDGKVAFSPAPENTPPS